MKKILIVDDDLHIGNMLEQLLRREGYEVLRAYSGTEAVLLLDKVRPDLVLLDLMLPGLSGQQVLEHLQNLPVIVMSARAGLEDKVNLLQAGAVDYVTKPFHSQELLARIAAHLRTYDKQAGGAVLTFADLQLDPAARTVPVGGEFVHLTPTEYAILKLLLQHQTQVLSKSVLLDRIAEDTPDCTEGSLKMHVSHLRKKLRQAGGRDYIESVWGIGFKLKAE